ncbi:MAG: MBL fold metallo-hydrolase [Bacteroidota bacterium]
MQRRSFIRNTGLSIGAVALSNQQILARFFADPAYKMRLLRNNTGIFTEKGGTILYMVNKKGIVVVDSQFPDSATHLIEELKKQSGKPFELLINTHHHGDHSGGNIAFKDLVKKVVAHANSKANQQAAAVKQKKEDQQLYPDTTFYETWEKKIGKEKIKMHHFGAAHTNGDSIVHFQHANIAHMGDLLFNRRHPYIDRTAGANIKSWISVLDKTLATFDDDTIFVFGHALDPEKVTGNKEDIKAFQNYLGKLLLFAETEFKAGKTKEEFIKNKAIPGETEWKGDGIERPLTAAFEEVSTK